MTKQLIKVGAKWCGPCKMLEAKIDTIADGGSEFVKTMRSVDIDTPEGEQIKRKYGIRSIPTLLVINSAGDCIDQLLPNSTGHSLTAVKNFINQHDPLGVA